MTKAIVTDLNKCVGCMACTVACKAINEIGPGEYWTKVLRVGPYPKAGGSGVFPDVDMYFLAMQCQHCVNAPCVEVCPTGASAHAEDGTVQIDQSLCIACRQCLSACPYGVRYIDATENVAKKCTLCHDRTEKGKLPQCVEQCAGLARWYGDTDEGLESFKGAYDRTLAEYLESGNVEPYEGSDIYQLPDAGNQPSMIYIMRNREWKGEFPILGEQA